jgi:sugar lactone lactonase YvrE
MKAFLLSSICFFALISAASAQFSGPESVEYHPASHSYFVSNTNTHLINRVWPGGNISVFVPNSQFGNSGPHGLEIVGDTLYACTGSRLRAFRLSDSTLLFNINLSAAFLNGITHDNNGYLFITDFTNKRIYRFNTQTRGFNIMISNTGTTPNGIIYDPYDGTNPRLVFVNWGASAQVKAVNLADSSITVLTTTALSNIDGICKGRNGAFYLASWSPARITAYDSTFAGPPVTISSNVNNPADICYNFDGDTIAVPNAGNNTVIYIGLTITSVSETAENHFLIYPNPAAAEIKFSLPFYKENYKVSFFNTAGAMVHSQNLPQTGSLDISDLPAGYFFVELCDNKGIIGRRGLMICR